MMNCELFTGFFELGYFFEYMLLFALLYSVLWEAKLCWMEFRAFVHSLYRRIFGGQHPRKYRRRRVTFDSRVYVRLFEPSSEELNERQAHWREVYARSKMILDVDDDEDEDEDEDDREDDPKEIDSVEESENLPGDEEGDGTAPESEEEETDACFPAVVDDDGDDDDDPVEPVEVGDYNNSDPPPLEQQQEPLGLERSSVNGWRSVRLARKPRVSYLGMC